MIEWYWLMLAFAVGWCSAMWLSNNTWDRKMREVVAEILKEQV